MWLEKRKIKINILNDDNCWWLSFNIIQIIPLLVRPSYLSIISHPFYISRPSLFSGVFFLCESAFYIQFLTIRWSPAWYWSSFKPLSLNFDWHFSAIERVVILVNWIPWLFFGHFYMVFLHLKTKLNVCVWFFFSFLFLHQDIDIKRQGAVSAYAFVQYADITSVVKSLRKMEGEHIGANKIKVLF